MTVAMDERQRRSNVRLALWLGLVALAFFVTFIAFSVYKGL
jgi:hypothetical protein